MVAGEVINDWVVVWRAVVGKVERIEETKYEIARLWLQPAENNQNVICVNFKENLGKN